MPGTANTPLYGLLGYPLGYSLSPAIQNAALMACNLPGHYLSLPVPPERLADAIAGMRAFRFAGLNVTIPYKVTVMPLLDGLTPRAQAIGAVNTLFWDGEQLLGDNTDALGFKASLPPGVVTGREALVLGAGGAARAVAVALRELGATAVHVVARREEAAEALRRDLLADVAGENVLANDPVGLLVVARCSGLVVNATPEGTHGKGTPLAGEVLAALPSGAYVSDLVYRPTETPLLLAARNRGLAGGSGLGMLVHQAAAAFTRWTGLLAPVAAMQAAATAEANKRGTGKLGP